MVHAAILRTIPRTMPRDATGVRVAILRELLRRELAHLPAPNWYELGATVQRSDFSVRRQCEQMRVAGLVVWDAGLARTLRLTDKGRAVAQGEQHNRS